MTGLRFRVIRHSLRHIIARLRVYDKTRSVLRRVWSEPASMP